MPPEHLHDLPILTDTAVATLHTEADTFVKASDLDPVLFDRYCIYDATHGIYRILVEASFAYTERP